MKHARITIYEDAAGLWRWRMQARNGKIIADGAEGYSEQRHAVRAAERLLCLAGSGCVVIG